MRADRRLALAARLLDAPEGANQRATRCHVTGGFVQSYAASSAFPSLSLLRDDLGACHDPRQASRLEQLLNDASSPLDGIEAQCDAAMQSLISAQLSRFNDAPPLAPTNLRDGDRQRVLVVDQSGDDADLAPGQDSAAFAEMLEAALTENPEATVYLYSPRTVAGAGRGEGFRCPSMLWKASKGRAAASLKSRRLVVLTHRVNPWSLIEPMQRVYTVSAHTGFEALLTGKPVSVFGMPWYAGWGATDDRRTCQRRTRQRSVRELFAAAYWRYSHYLNPETHQVGDLFDVMAWLVRQRDVESQVPGRVVMVGFRHWKVANLRDRLSLSPERIRHVSDANRAAALTPGPQDALVAWGRDIPEPLRDLARRSGARLLHMEDGFVRSVGLGSDMVPPASVVLDERGIYFDPTQPSDLEDLLNTRQFTEDECRRARRVRELIVQHRLTKYNIEPHQEPAWATRERHVVLVPGQVEDDASIRYGAGAVRTNLGLLEAARAAHPDAFLVYKPHPDVVLGGRSGQLVEAPAGLVDHIETQLSVISCIEACDTLHTMTSLTGFDALLRGKHVVTYGEPFYAGWGLTEDRALQVTGADARGHAMARRTRRLSLDELVAGALLCYPRYWDSVLHGYTSCESVLQRVIREREALSDPVYRRLGYLRRQWRKLNIIRPLYQEKALKWKASR